MGTVRTTLILGYRWEIFDDEFGSSLLTTVNIVNPNYSFASAGRKLIRLTATDNNSVGNCGGVYEGYVDIIATAEATIATHRHRRQCFAYAVPRQQLLYGALY